MFGEIFELSCNRKVFYGIQLGYSSYFIFFRNCMILAACFIILEYSSSANFLSCWRLGALLLASIFSISSGIHGANFKCHPTNNVCTHAAHFITFPPSVSLHFILTISLSRLGIDYGSPGQIQAKRVGPNLISLVSSRHQAYFHVYFCVFVPK